MIGSRFTLARFALAAFAALGAIGVLGGATCALEAKVRAEPKVLAAFKLEDHTGRVFDNARLNDRWTIVLIGFTSCPDVCPATLQNAALVIEELSTLVSPARIPQVVFLGVDPERDKSVLPQYVPYFNPDFVGVTGEAGEIGKLVEGLEGFYRVERKTPEASPVVQHSAVVSVLDPQGRLRAGLYPPMQPKETAEFLVGLMRQYTAQARQSE